MKSIKLLTIITILFLNTYSKMYSEGINKQDTLIEPIIINTMGWNPSKITKSDMVHGMAQFGYSFYTKIKTDSLEGKTIGQIINSLEYKELIGYKFSNRFKKTDGLVDRTYEMFDIYIKNSDTTTICIGGALDYKNLLSENEEIAFRELLQQTKFCLNFYEINVKIWNSYTKKNNYKQILFPKKDRLELDIFRKNFPSIFRKHKK